MAKDSHFVMIIGFHIIICWLRTLVPLEFFCKKCTQRLIISFVKIRLFLLFPSSFHSEKPGFRILYPTFTGKESLPCGITSAIYDRHLTAADVKSITPTKSRGREFSGRCYL